MKGMIAMEKITKDIIIADLIEVDTGLVPILLQSGMHCIGCPSSLGETLEEAAFVHGLDVDDLVEDLNDYLESKIENDEATEQEVDG